MGVEFKGKIMSNYFWEVEWEEGVTAEIRLCVYNILGYWCEMYFKSAVVNTQKLWSSCPWSIPWRGKHEMLFNVDIVK